MIHCPSFLASLFSSAVRRSSLVAILQRENGVNLCQCIYYRSWALNCQSLTSSSSLLVIGHAFLISNVVQAHVHVHVHVYVRHKITTKITNNIKVVEISVYKSITVKGSHY